MNPSSLPFRVWATLGILALVPAGVLQAAEPQARFTLKHGWVELILRQDGKPVPGAALRILDANTHQFSEGETNATGKTEFPLPRGPGFIAEITLGERTADPIWIERDKDGIEPEQVLLSFGLHPCCQMPAVETARPAPVESAPAAQHLLFSYRSAAVVALGVSGIAFLLWSLARFTRSDTDLAPREVP
jgi:hypothetical protein